MIKKLVLWGGVLPFLVCGFLPVFFMFLSSVVADGKFSLEAYSGLLHSKRQWLLFYNSLTLATIVAVNVVLAGVPIGILIGKSDLPLRRWLFFFLSIPLLIPPYIVAVAWDQLLASIQEPAFFFSGLAPNKAPVSFGGLGGSVLVLSTVYLPIPVIFTSFFVRTVNPRFEEAARLSASWPRVLKEITLPLIWPGIIFSAMLVFVLVIGQVSVPSYLRFQVFSVESFTRFSALYDFKGAIASSLPLSVMTLFLPLLEAYWAKRWSVVASGSTRAEGLLQIGLGKWKMPVFLIVFGVVVVFIVLPLGYLVFNSFKGDVYPRAIAMATDPLKRSLLYSAIAASILSICGFTTAYAIKSRAICCWRYLDAAGLFLFAMPGTVIGMGLIGLWNSKWSHFIYGSMSIVIFGYLAKYYIVSVKAITVRLLQIPQSMEEAAQLAGASWPKRMLSILLPLSKRSILAAWLCVFIFCLRDTDITMLVYPPGCDTLPVRIFTTMANGSPQLVAAMCMLMVISVVVPAIFLWLAAAASKAWDNV